MNNDLLHYGMPRRSGRYPYGSGERPYQSEEKQLSKKEKVVKEVLGRDINRNKLVSKNAIDMNRPIKLKKGEKVQHISGVEMHKVKEGQLYVTFDQYDNDLYQAFLSGMLLSKGYGAKKVDLSLIEDLNAPSPNRQYELFKNNMKKQDVLNDIAKWLVDKNKFSDKESALNHESKKNISEIYSDFINSCESSSNSRTNFYNLLKKEGYNALLDVHDRESWISAKQPIILMEALDVIGDVKISDLSIKDINKALDRWFKENI